MLLVVYIAQRKCDDSYTCTCTCRAILAQFALSDVQTGSKTWSILLTRVESSVTLPLEQAWFDVQVMSVVVIYKCIVK